MNEKAVSTLEKFKKILNVGNYSENTIKMYINYVGKFLISFNKSPSHINTSDINNYLLNYKKSSISQYNQVYSSLKLFASLILNIKYLDKIFNGRPRKELHLPNTINEDVILNTISNISNLKHKAILSITYSIGLRRSEVINLKLDDIDSDNMVINIKQAKGKKDRNLPLSEKVLNILRQYYIQYKPKEYLFEGQFKSYYSGSSLNNIIKKYFGSKYHFHNLRHSTATNLLNKGVDISFIKELLGHKDIKTTMIYLKISTKNLQNLPLGI